jgi:hypothetical protein
MNDFMESLGEYEEFDENGRVTSPLVVAVAHVGCEIPTRESWTLILDETCETVLCIIRNGDNYELKAEARCET